MKRFLIEIETEGDTAEGFNFLGHVEEHVNAIGGLGAKIIEVEKTTERVLVRWDHEGLDGGELVEMTKEDADKIKQLFAGAKGEYPEGITEIINRATKIQLYGDVSTAGDGSGWWDADGEPA